MLWINFRVREEGVDDVLASIASAFAALDEERPPGIRYAYYRVPDTAQFVVTIELAEGVRDPIGSIEAIQTLRATLGKWAVGGPPVPAPLHVLGRYDGLSQQAR